MTFQEFKIYSKNILRGDEPLVSIWHYIVGNYRYRLYYSDHPIIRVLMRRFIKHQIDIRIINMSSECFENGECKMCGCQTTHLQMANKACDKPCYPKMMKKSLWKIFITGKLAITEGNNTFIFNKKTNKIKIYNVGDI